MKFGGILFAALIVLGTIAAYNYFTKDGIATLGRPTA